MAKRSLILFDVDGTLAMSTKVLSDEMKTLLASLKDKYDLGIIGGSPITQHKFQVGETEIFQLFDYVFSENGVQAYHNGELIHNNDLRIELGEEKIKEIIDFCLHYIANLDLPKKRGKFIDFRKGLLYITPMGNQCDLEERYEFIEFDQRYRIRDEMVKALSSRFGDLNVKIGGQIGIGISPPGWDKSYCLKHLDFDQYNQVHFFGDQTGETGNDYVLYVHPKIIGHSVDSPDDTYQVLQSLN